MTRVIQFAVAAALTLSFAVSAQADLTGYWRSIHTTCDVISPNASAAALSEVKREHESTYWLWLILQPNDDEVLGLTSLHDYDHDPASDSRLGEAQVWMRADLSPAGDEFEWDWDSGHMVAELLSPHHLRLTYQSERNGERESFVTSDCVRHYLRVPAPPSLQQEADQSDLEADFWKAAAEAAEAEAMDHAHARAQAEAAAAAAVATAEANAAYWKAVAEDHAPDLVQAVAAAEACRAELATTVATLVTTQNALAVCRADLRTAQTVVEAETPALHFNHGVGTYWEFSVMFPDGGSTIGVDSVVGRTTHRGRDVLIVDQTYGGNLWLSRYVDIETGNVLAEFDQDREIMQEWIPHTGILQHPLALEVGASWEAEVQYISQLDDGTPEDRVIEYEVAEFMELTVGAGTFDAYRVVEVETENTVWWYAPEVVYPIKGSVEGDNGLTEWEVIDYELSGTTEGGM